MQYEILKRKRNKFRIFFKINIKRKEIKALFRNNHDQTKIN